MQGKQKLFSGGPPPKERPKDWARPVGSARYVFTARRLADMVKQSPEGLTVSEIVNMSGAKHEHVLDLVVLAVAYKRITLNGHMRQVPYAPKENRSP